MYFSLTLVAVKMVLPKLTILWRSSFGYSASRASNQWKGFWHDTISHIFLYKCICIFFDLFPVNDLFNISAPLWKPILEEIHGHPTSIFNPILLLSVCKYLTKIGLSKIVILKLNHQNFHSKIESPKIFILKLDHQKYSF